jgi:hypothetical protein
MKEKPTKNKNVAALILNMPCRVSGDNVLLALFTKIHLQFVSPLERGL